jgi:hypothetical protein
MFCDLRVRSLPHRRLRSGLIPLTLAAAGLSAPLLLTATPASAQQAGYGQTLGTTPMERQMYDGGTGRPNSGSILDSTNPIDLMNKIRRSTAMDEATPPASAIDQALQQLEAQSSPAAAGPDQAATGDVSGSTRPVGTAPVWAPSATPQSPSGSTPQRPAL